VHLEPAVAARFGWLAGRLGGLVSASAGIKGQRAFGGGSRCLMSAPCRSIPSSLLDPETWRSMPYVPEKLEGLKGGSGDQHFNLWFDRKLPRSTTFCSVVPICSACTPTMSNTCRSTPIPDPFHAGNWCCALPEALGSAAADADIIAGHHGRNSKRCSPTTSGGDEPAPPGQGSTWSRRRSRVYKIRSLAASSSGPPSKSPIANFFPGEVTTPCSAYLASMEGAVLSGQSSAPRRSASPPGPCGDRVTVLVASPTATPRSSLNLDQAYEACRQETAPVAKLIYLGHAA